MCRLKELFRKANAKFLRENRDDLDYEVKKSSFCHSLAKHIQAEFVGTEYEGCYDEIEYNRKFNCKVKTIFGDEVEEPISIRCDLTIHSKNKMGANANVLALQMQKLYRSKKEKDVDRNRLIALTKRHDAYIADGFILPESACGYKLGVYYEINKTKKQMLVEYYENGEKTDEETIGY